MTSNNHSVIQLSLSISYSIFTCHLKAFVNKRMEYNYKLEELTAVFMWCSTYNVGLILRYFEDGSIGYSISTNYRPRKISPVYQTYCHC